MRKATLPSFLILSFSIIALVFVAASPVNSVQLTSKEPVRIVYTRPEVYNITSYGSGSIWIWDYLYVIRGAALGVNDSLQVSNVLVGVYCAYADWICICRVNVYIFDSDGTLLSSGNSFLLLNEGEFGVANVTLSNTVPLEDVYEVKITP